MSSLEVQGTMTDGTEASHYDRKSEWQYQQGIRLAAAARIQPGQVLLDIGCGTGRLTKHLAEMVSPAGRVVAVDIDADRLHFARNNYQHENLVYRRVDAENLEAGNFQDDSFDVVYCNFAVHWIKDKTHLFDVVRRILRQRGVFAISVVQTFPDAFLDLSRSTRDDGRQILHRARFECYEALAPYLQAAGLSPREQDVETFKADNTFASFDELLSFWEGVTEGAVSAETIPPDRLQTLREKYAYSPIVVEESIARVVAEHSDQGRHP